MLQALSVALSKTHTVSAGRKESKQTVQSIRSSEQPNQQNLFPLPSSTTDFCTIHHHHLFLNREGHWDTTDDFATSFLHFSLFSTALWDLPNSRPVHSLMLSSHLFLCPPRLLPPFTVPYKIVLARPDERET